MVLVTGVIVAAVAVLHPGPSKVVAQPAATQPAPTPSPAAPPAQPLVAPVSGLAPAAAFPADLPGSPPATQPAVPVATTEPATQPAGDLSAQLTAGLKLLGSGKVIEGRAALSKLYFNYYAQLATQDAQAIRDTLSSVNQKLLFGPKVTPGDPLCAYYQFQAGDVLGKIAWRYKIPYHLIEQINHVDARHIWVGRRLKVINGPFDAIVHKSEFRIDVYLKDAAGHPIYATSFPVGLGKSNSTPVGLWIVAPGGKVANPGWTDPNTNRYYPPTDPNVPIGKFWMALQGVDDATRNKHGYGIHGTIDPNSIGKEMSLGCIRLRADDIAQLFRLLVERYSTVQVVP